MPGGTLKSFSRAIGSRLQQALVIMLWGLARLLPVAAGSALGAAVMGWLGPWQRKHRHIKRNLRIANPAMSAHEIEQLARGVWRNLGSVIFEYPHLQDIYARRGENKPGPGCARAIRR